MNHQELYELAVDDLAAATAGYGCGLCLDTGWLDGVGPCESCRPDRFVEHLLDLEAGQVTATWADEHDSQAAEVSR